MPEFVRGLPLHFLVVHFVVVLMSLAAISAVVIALWPAARRRFGWLVVAAAAAATVLVPVATNSGAKIKRRIVTSDNQAAIDEHQRLGDLMLYFALALVVSVAALMILHEVARRRQFTWMTLATAAVIVLTVGTAVVAAVHVYRVGDAGSRAAWDFVKDQQPH